MFSEKKFKGHNHKKSIHQLIYPLGGEVILHLNKCQFLLSMDALCQVWLKLANASSGKDFKHNKHFSVESSLFIWCLHLWTSWDILIHRFMSSLTLNKVIM